MIIIPINKNNDIDDIACDIDVIIDDINPILFKLIIDISDKFKCIIDEKAIIFFKS